jgi:hypothetical protein
MEAGLQQSSELSVGRNPHRLIWRSALTDLRLWPRFRYLSMRGECHQAQCANHSIHGTLLRLSRWNGHARFVRCQTRPFFRFRRDCQWLLLMLDSSNPLVTGTAGIERGPGRQRKDGSGVRSHAGVRRRLWRSPRRSACTFLLRGSGRPKGTQGRSWSGPGRQKPFCPVEP